MRCHRSDGTIASETGCTHPAHARHRAADIECETRQGTFTDPRKAQTTFGEWTEVWSDAHEVAESTWAKYRAHLRNHILPRFADTPLADISPIKVKQWVKGLRRRLGDAIVTILSMILAEAVDEDHLGKNPCRRLRLNLAPSAPKETATAGVVRHVADRYDPAYRTMITTAAYTGMRWGELAGLQWHPRRHPHPHHRQRQGRPPRDRRPTRARPTQNPRQRPHPAPARVPRLAPT